MAKSERLARNFHQTFKPERQYLNALLRYAAAGKSGTYQEIGAETGIPMGASSGKAKAILDYCRGMGLVTLRKTSVATERMPDLTPFGRIVLLEDPYLTLSITQWISHFNLCSVLSGAELWYQAFCVSTPSLGITFSRTQLETYLQNAIGVNSAKIIGPMVSSYEDDAAFKACGAISEKNKIVMRTIAPVKDVFGYAYGAWILQLMADHFPKGGQISVVELNTLAGWRFIPAWGIDNVQQVLELVERKGLISIDRHMHPWLLQAKVEPQKAWKMIFDDMI